MKLCGALSELQWGGWKLIESPHVVKLTPTLLDQYPKEAVALLAALWKGGRLGEVDQAWKGRVEEWVGEWFARWERTEEMVGFFDIGTGLSRPSRTLTSAFIDRRDA